MYWVLRKFISLLVITLSTFFGIIIFELGLKLLNSNDEWHIVKKGNILRNFYYSYDVTTLYSTKQKKVEYIRNEFGLRDNCKSTKDINILTVGGSTTDQRFVAFKSTYQYILEDKLKEFDKNFGCVTNAGVDGHSTWGHIFSFEKWFPLIPDLQPKYVLLYIGVNDVNFKRANTPTKNDQNLDQNQNKFLENFQTYNSLMPIYKFLQMKFDKKSTIPYHGRFPHNITDNDYQINLLNSKTKELSKINADSFKIRLQRILKYIHNLNAIPICVTQPHRYATIKSGQIYGVPNVYWGEGFSGVDYDYSIRKINAVIKELCINTLDLYNYKFKKGDFYDGIHTTSSGSKKIGEEMASFIISNFY